MNSPSGARIFISRVSPGASAAGTRNTPARIFRRARRYRRRNERRNVVAAITPGKSKGCGTSGDAFRGNKRDGNRGKNNGEARYRTSHLPGTIRTGIRIAADRECERLLFA
ncbi:hypothetical protein K0M31_013521, partial [Melipona bicolor]